MKKNIKFIAPIVCGVILASGLTATKTYAATTKNINSKGVYLLNSRIQKNNIVYAQINKDNTPIRDARSLGGNVIAVRGQGYWVEVDLDNSYGDWYAVSRDGIHGYVYWRDITINR